MGSGTSKRKSKKNTAQRRYSWQLSPILFNSPTVDGAFFLNGICIQTVFGCITEAQTDCIVHPTGLKIDFAGQIGQKILEAGGPAVQQIQDRHIPGFCLASHSGRLTCDTIIHVNIYEGEATEVILQCLQEADKLKKTSITIPIIGTGAKGTSFEDMVASTMNAISAFQMTAPRTLQFIDVISNKIDEVSIVTNRFANDWLFNTDDISSIISSDDSDILDEVGGDSSFGHTNNVPVPLAFDVDEDGYNSFDACSLNGKGLPPGDALCSSRPLIGNVLKFSCCNLSICSLFGILPKAKTDCIVYYAVKNGPCFYRSPRWREYSCAKDFETDLMGLPYQDLDAACFVYDSPYKPSQKLIFINTDKVDILGWLNLILECFLAAERLQKTSITLPVLGPESNSNSAAAKLKTMTEAILLYADRPLKTLKHIDIITDDVPTFKSMEFVLQDFDRQHNCQFRRRLSVPVPVSDFRQVWTNMSQSGPSSLIKLNNASLEFHCVRDKVKVKKARIKEIFRIQNTKLYDEYVNKKHKIALEMNSPPSKLKTRVVERELWHGSSGDICEKICHDGFNRSFAGQNGTVFGEGVYFAEDAQYSASDTYAVVDKRKMKNILLCDVLTGLYTGGEDEMKEPPTIDPQIPGIRYHSLVDDVNHPSVFVIFQDGQAYPKYLIKFKVKEK